MERTLSKNKRKYSELQKYIQSQSTSLTNIFTEAEQYPSFFQDNLVDSDRTIKLFYHQQYAHQTIFYFQLLKLIYETEETYFEKYLAKIYDLIDNPEFQMQSPPRGHKYHVGLTDFKMKRMIQQFLDELGEGSAGVSEVLVKYPIMDKIFVIFMKTILLLGDMCQSFDQSIDTVELYEFLADYFEVGVTYYTNCIKFNLTDIFVYFQTASQIYLAFITPKQSDKSLPASEVYYQSEEEDAFNISSVRQMVSEIDIAAEEECFDISKQGNSINESQQIEYDYSHTQDVRPSKSTQEPSQLKLSGLGSGEDSSLQSLNFIKSNKILEKQNINDKNSILKPYINMKKCFEIQEVPMELQNASSPLATPGGASYVERKYQDSYMFSAYRYKDSIADHISFADTGESQNIFRNARAGLKSENKWASLKQEAQVLFEEPQTKTLKNLKNLYEMRSIKTIISCNDSQSFNADTPTARSNFQTSFTSFNPSFQPSGKGSHDGPYLQSPPKKNAYTKYGYINNNISHEYTNSILLKQLGEPFKGNISGVKARARKERTRIQNMINF